MSLIEEILRETPDTKACRLGPGVTEQAAELFKELFPTAGRALVVDDVNTKRVAGDRVVALLKDAGIEVSEYTINPDGSWFHATYDKVEEVRDVIFSTSTSTSSLVPVAVGSGTINDLVKRGSEEAGVRYMVVGTASSMDGYTSFGASITKDGMKQTLPCRAPLGALVDTQVAAEAPKEMTASGYADLIAKVPAGADWMLADAIAAALPETEKHGCERIHPLAWKCVQGPLRASLANPAGVATGDEGEIRKLSEGLIMSAFAMQASGTSRPASGTEHRSRITGIWRTFASRANPSPTVSRSALARLPRRRRSSSFWSKISPTWMSRRRSRSGRRRLRNWRRRFRPSTGTVRTTSGAPRARWRRSTRRRTSCAAS